ncbi:hypothetical protein OPV22_030013 [Ensete ventricosum]|uniref:ZF-HD dimerization-type domain-containing protein n=1 Tax=Ensete ventricosum TaxID=4639 RepID=A0AAV8P6P1_ENSVE|nr:hypothetical protein OPV22_030013 [Ensete ventricosum]
MGLHHQAPRKDSNGSAAKKEKVVVKYKECRKNHAASIGGYAVDGCREFMASGEEGTSAALVCAACNCHRSFHKREVDTDPVCDSSSNSTSPRISSAGFDSSMVCTGRRSLLEEETPIALLRGLVAAEGTLAGTAVARTHDDEIDLSERAVDKRVRG